MCKQAIANHQKTKVRHCICPDKSKGYDLWAIQTKTVSKRLNSLRVAARRLAWLFYRKFKERRNEAFSISDYHQCWYTDDSGLMKFGSPPGVDGLVDAATFIWSSRLKCPVFITFLIGVKPW